MLHCDLEDMSMVQGQDTPVDHAQQFCEILFKSNLTLTSYFMDTDFPYVCIVALTLGIWPWVKVMTHHLVMENNCVKYYQNQALQ